MVGRLHVRTGDQQRVGMFHVGVEKWAGHAEKAPSRDATVGKTWWEGSTRGWSSG